MHFYQLDPAFAYLSAYSRNDNSQFGEDGLIQALIRQAGEGTRTCFEVGAHDGVFLSNTKRLRDLGWRAVLIEQDAELHAKLAEFENDRVSRVHESVGPDSLDRILDAAGMPEDVTVGVIDIDGQDYWVWHGMTRFRPRIMCVEFAYWNPPDHIPKLDDDDRAQAGMQAVIDLGKSKGYVPAAATNCNVLFIRKDRCNASVEP